MDWLSASAVSCLMYSCIVLPSVLWLLPQSDSGLGKPMTEQELAVLRKAMGVNSYGTFVDRSAATQLIGSCSHVGAVMLASCLGLSSTLVISAPCSACHGYVLQDVQQTNIRMVVKCLVAAMLQVLWPQPQGGGRAPAPRQTLCQRPVPQH
jgi:hypothetical protein